MRDELYEVKI